MNNPRGRAIPLRSLGDFLEELGFGMLLQRPAHNNTEANDRYVSYVNPAGAEGGGRRDADGDYGGGYAEIGSEVKEKPCGHKFHGDCIISWLKLRSSYPFCRFQLP